MDPDIPEIVVAFFDHHYPGERRGVGDIVSESNGPDRVCLLIEDACATSDLKYGDDITLAKDVHNATLSTLTRTYARVMTTEEFLNYLKE